MLRSFLTLLLSFLILTSVNASAESHVAVIRMNMMILPGTSEYLIRSVNEAEKAGAKIAVVYLNTPGGILQTTQEMVQFMFQSPIPVAVYVAPEGATAASAGVFITMAGHLAVMGPGTSIGAAHPVQGDGKNIEGDMRQKAENMTVSMAKSISEQRRRNAAWVEKAVRESVSVTDNEAVKEKIIDFTAIDISELLKKATGREVIVQGKKVILEDLSSLPLKEYPPSTSETVLNFMANPSVAAILWLVATTGISIELYNPGLVFPGIMGVICLILALIVTQTVPVNAGALMLLASGALMVLAELKFASGILGIGGVVAMVLGALYFVDTSMAPGLAVSLQVVLPFAVVLGGFLIAIIFALRRSLNTKLNTGKEGVIGLTGVAHGDFSNSGQVFLNGAMWKAEVQNGAVSKGDKVKVVDVKGLTLFVEKI